MKSNILLLFFISYIYSSTFLKQQEKGKSGKKVYRKVLKGKFLTSHKITDNNYNILTNEAFCKISLYPFFSSKITKFPLPLDTSQTYYILSDNIFIYCIIEKSDIKCSIYNIDKNAITNSFFVPIKDKTKIIKKSLYIFPYSSHMNSDSYMILWFESNNYINFAIYDKYNNMQTNIQSIKLDNHDNSQNHISFSQFPSGKLLFNYIDNKCNVIQILSQENFTVIETFYNIIPSSEPAKVTILNEEYFIVCLLKNKKKGYCKITNVNNKDNYNSIFFPTYTNVFGFSSLSEFEFIIVVKRNERELQAQIIDIEGNKKSESLILSLAKANIAISEFFYRQNTLLLLYANNDDVIIEKYNINILCDQYNIQVNLNNIKDNKCFDLNFDYYIRNGRDKANKSVIITELPINGILYSKENNNNNTKAIIDKEYSMNELKLCFDSDLNEDMFPIIIKYKGINSFFDESSICSIKIYTRKTINNTITFNDNNSLNKENNIYLNKKITITFFLIPIALLCILFFFREKTAINSEEALTHYLNYFYKNQLTSYLDVKQILLFMVNKYSTLSSLINPPFNPFYSKKLRLLYALNKLLISLYYSVNCTLSSVRSRDTFPIILFKSIIMFPVVSYFFSFISTIIVNRILIKQYYIGDFSVLDKEKVKQIALYHSVNEHNNLNINYKDKSEQPNYSNSDFKEIPKIYSLGFIGIIVAYIVRLVILQVFSIKNIKKYLTMIISNVIIQFTHHFIIEEIVYILIYGIILDRYCFEMHNPIRNKFNGKIVNKNSILNKIFKKLYYLFIPPHIESDYFALEIYSKWMSENVK